MGEEDNDTIFSQKSFALVYLEFTSSTYTEKLVVYAQSDPGWFTIQPPYWYKQLTILYFYAFLYDNTNGRSYYIPSL